MVTSSTSEPRIMPSTESQETLVPDLRLIHFNDVYHAEEPDAGTVLLPKRIPRGSEGRKGRGLNRRLDSL